MTHSMHATPSAWPDYASIATSLGADLVSVVPDRHGKSVLTVTWPDGCTSLVLVMDQGNDTVRAWPESDLDRIEFHATYARSGLYWFVDTADLPASSGCDAHVCAHWRAQHDIPVLAAA